MIVNFVVKVIVVNFVIVNAMQLNWGLHMFMHIIIIVNIKIHEIVDYV